MDSIFGFSSSYFFLLSSYSLSQANKFSCSLLPINNCKEKKLTWTVWPDQPWASPLQRESAWWPLQCPLPSRLHAASDEPEKLTFEKIIIKTKLMEHSNLMTESNILGEVNVEDSLSRADLRISTYNSTSLEKRKFSVLSKFQYLSLNFWSTTGFFLLQMAMYFLKNGSYEIFFSW